MSNSCSVSGMERARDTSDVAAAGHVVTIVDAIRAVMVSSEKPLKPQEIYEAITAADLYKFHADDPVGVVRAQIRRRCEGLDFASAYPTKMFQLDGDGRYSLLVRASEGRIDAQQRAGADSTLSILARVKSLLDQHQSQVRTRLAAHLKALEPSQFERFAAKLMVAYGFEGMQVTQRSKDGGIDGHGRLRVGLASLRVAFQCKRWTAPVQRPDVDRFRGAIQGDFEQGVFFTTSRFSLGAVGVSIRRGAVPIILIDLDGILDLMLQRKRCSDRTFIARS